MLSLFHINAPNGNQQPFAAWRASNDFSGAFINIGPPINEFFDFLPPAETNANAHAKICTADSHEHTHTHKYLRLGMGIQSTMRMPCAYDIYSFWLYSFDGDTLSASPIPFEYRILLFARNSKTAMATTATASAVAEKECAHILLWIDCLASSGVCVKEMRTDWEILLGADAFWWTADERRSVTEEGRGQMRFIVLFSWALGRWTSTLVTLL